MCPKAKNLSASSFRDECLRGIECDGDRILAIHDMPTGPRLKLLFWIMAGGIPLLVVLSMAAPPTVSAVLMGIFVLVLLVAAQVRRTYAEIDLHGREVRMTWKAGPLVRQKAYALDDDVAVTIQDKGQVFEGYTMPLFSVVIAGRGKQITLYTTDDPEEAMAVQREIAAFMRTVCLSTQQRQSV